MRTTGKGEKELLCSCCKKEPIYIKSTKLCKKCYYIKYKENRKNKEIRHRAEVLFIQTYFTHNNWIYQPAIFNLGEYKYTPDFYDCVRNVFIEVVGTHQAFYDNREKYNKFVELFPLIPFEIRNSDGSLFERKKYYTRNGKMLPETTF